MDVSKKEFNQHIGKKLGISEEKAREITAAVFDSLYHFVKNNERNVEVKHGFFTIIPSKNGFKTLALWEKK